ncbi:MAG: M20/M25/M40 family metallo-hydrolase [Chitinophagaceae bacterium]|nr:M20/M25/M40 family metallo-hydrolase [Chitinophagaceae bacterium]
MKKLLLSGLLLSIASCLFAQKNPATLLKEVITIKEVERIERVLASDDMRGRKIYTPEIEKAADFIAAEFKAAGLEPLKGANGFRQEFVTVSPKQTSISATLNGATLDPKNVLVVTSQPHVKIDQSSGYEVVSINAGANLFEVANNMASAGKNRIIMVDESFAKNFPRLAFFKRNLNKSDKNVVFILGNAEIASINIEAAHDIKEQKLANVVGVLPGKTKKDEYVIFSGHYDHIGIGKPVDGDSINNGANDDAAGITAVILLAKFYKALGNNDRTIVFAAFTAEESGGFGSQYFSKQMDPAKVMAMFNIEMIGTESKWGKNSAYITGFEMTDMGKILETNLKGSGFTFHPDPYPDQQLFYRSDNATLAKQGVPAHTISTSKMDVEPNYHKVTDHVETLDLDNMAMIIRSIAISARSIVAGKDTPSRVKAESLTR